MDVIPIRAVFILQQMKYASKLSHTSKSLSFFVQHVSSFLEEAAVPSREFLHAAGDYFECRTRFTVIISSAVSSVSFITFVVCSVIHCGHSSIDPVQQDSSGKWLFRDTLSNY